MRSFSLGLIALLLISFASCRKDDITTTEEIIPPTPSVKIETSVHGLVVNENEEPMADVQVRMGSSTTTTNDLGYFELTDFQSSDRALVVAEKPGYFKAYPVFKPNEGSRENLKIQMIERQLSATLDASSGGEMELPSGARADFAAGSFVTTDGQAYSGSVEVYAHYLDPTDPNLNQFMPGNLTAINSESEMRALVTYGMINVELQSPSGVALDIAENATITLPVPAELQSKAPETIPLWYYDEAIGLWVEEGSASLSGNEYIGEVSHFTFWNCDIPFPFVEINGQVDVNGYTPSLEVRLTRIDNGDWASDQTDDKGLFDGKVPTEVVFLMEFINDCGTVIYSEEIGPFSQDTDLGTYFVTNSDGWSLISGTLLDCDGNPASGTVTISGNGGLYEIATTLANGSFLKFIPTCSNSTIEVTGYDFENQEQSDPIEFTVEDVVDLGTIQACGNTFVTGIQFEMDGHPDFFLPFATATYTFDQGTQSYVYTITSVFESSPGNYTETEYIFIDWNQDPTNPLWTMAYEQDTFGSPTETWVPGGGDITLIYADTNPGGLIQFVISNCTPQETISGNEYLNGTVTFTAVMQ